MNNVDEPDEQFTRELLELRQQVAKLKALENERQQALNAWYKTTAN